MPVVMVALAVMATIPTADAIAREKAQNKEHTQLDHSDAEDKIGTVGAVAVDTHGNLAAATSTSTSWTNPALSSGI